jgi:hypothetical protein
MFVLCTAYGCGGGKGNAMPPLGPTLEVVNHSSLVYRVTLGPSRVFQVHPGQRKCVRVGNIHQTLSIEFLALAGSRTHRTPPENLMSSPGWIVEIGLQPALDVLTLRPADPCME